jgi:ADP-ribose pyrophosphatase
VRSFLWAAPAGLLDVDGEHPWRTAERELLEEAHHVATTWHTLYDAYLSPGASSEALRCYLARDVSPATGERYAGSGEERDMEQLWVPLDEVVERALAGRLHNPTLMLGALATAAARERGWSTLRPPDDPWPERFPDGLPPL